MAELQDLDLSSVSEFEDALKGYSRSNAKKYRYYYQERSVPDLGVSTPPKLRYLKQLIGWPTMAVDVLLERINFKGFYSPRAEDDAIVEVLNSVYRQNFFETEQKASQKDSMITGSAYISISTGDTSIGEPEVIWRSESPTQVYGVYDSRTHKLGATMKLIDHKGFIEVELVTPDGIYSLTKDKRIKVWNLVNAQENPLGYVPYVFIPNNVDSMFPQGRTEITPSIRSLTDSGMRTLMNAEVIREYFTQPLRSIAGLNPADLFTPDGKQKTLWDLVAGGLLNIPFNSVIEEMPEIKELTASSPKDVMDQLESYGKLIAREIGVPPSYMGFETTNPSSAEAINEADKKLILKAKARIPVLSRAYKQMAQITLDILGYENVDISFIETLFARPETPTPAAAADRLSKMNAMGVFDKELPNFVYRDLDMTEIDIIELKEYLREQGGNALINSLISNPTGAISGNNTTA